MDGHRKTSRRRRTRSWTSVLAVAALAGCSSSAPECSFFSNICNPVVGPQTFPPVGSVYPGRLTVQVGSAASFSVNTTVADAVTYQWRRSSDGGNSYVDIAGANGPGYTLAAANLVDDGAMFTVDVRSNGVSVLQTIPARLTVSSMPGVVLEDSEFAPADWTTADIAAPTPDGPAAIDEQVPSGGNPGAFRRTTAAMTAGPSSLRILNLAQTMSYDPSVQGAVHAIDFAEDCIVTAGGGSSVFSTLLVEQGGRRYVPTRSNLCFAPQWAALTAISSQSAADLVQFDGPVCGPGESCPDFSAGAAPLRFGYVRDLAAAAGAPAGTTIHGIDNWRVTVWRR
jgi:hypothetical protein